LTNGGFSAMFVSSESWGFGELLYLQNEVEMEEEEESSELRPIETRKPENNGRFAIYQLLGRGGMSEVFLGFDHKTGRDVALKKFPVPKGGTDREREEFSQRMLREVRLQASLDHPNLPEFIDVVQDTQGPVYLVMEHVRGADLGQIIDTAVSKLGDARPRRSLLPLSHVYSIARQLFTVLDVLHEKQIIHRDIKPPNIMCTDSNGSPMIKLIDFGIGKSLIADVDHYKNSLTRQGVMIGTPHYLAPEQAADSKNVDHRADLYAAGCVLYELVTGKTTIDLEGAPLIVKLSVELQQPFGPEKYPSKLVDDMNPLLERLILDLLERDPKKRIGSARLAMQRLEEAERSSEGGGSPPLMITAKHTNPSLAPTLSDVVVTPSGESLAPVIPMKRHTMLWVVGAMTLLMGVILALSVTLAQRSKAASATTYPVVMSYVAPIPTPVTASAPTSTLVAPVTVVRSPVSVTSVSAACTSSAMKLSELSRSERVDFEVIRKAIDGSAKACLGRYKKDLILLTSARPTFADAYRLLGECMRREGNAKTQHFYLETYAKLTCANARE
jgi:serine/threonine protein kinase